MSRRRLLALALVTCLPLLAVGSGVAGFSGEMERSLTLDTADDDRALFAADLSDRIDVERGGPDDTERTVRLGTASNAFPGQSLLVEVDVERDGPAPPTIRAGDPVALPSGTSLPIPVHVDCGDELPGEEAVELVLTATGPDVEASTTHDLTVACSRAMDGTDAPTNGTEAPTNGPDAETNGTTTSADVQSATATDIPDPNE